MPLEILMRIELTQERLKEVLHYDPETGAFTWRVSQPPRGAPGKLAGSTDYLNRRVISYGGTKYLAHRLAWLYVHGKWPSDVVDHVNGDPSDNRLTNLRACTRLENQQNQGSRGRRSKSGILGACWDAKAGKWVAMICVQYVSKFLGYYDTPEEAHQAYLAAKAKYHTFQPVPRDA